MRMEKATFGSGCFWCAEAIFKRVKGVTSVLSGYSGGKLTNPTYSKLHQHNSGHVECIQFEFDPNIIQYKVLIEIFFGTHNPTELNKQGNDIGEEYRSVIFYHSEEQKKVAEQVRDNTEKAKTFENPIVTAIEPFKAFYEAEAEHKNFYENNPNQPYCQIVIDPKIAKFRSKYSHYLN